MLDARQAAAADPSRDSQLVAALAQYLSTTRNKDEIRRAINVWRNDVEGRGAQPEKILIQFKQILLGLKDKQQSSDYSERLSDNREMILMCIEEYFAASATEGS